MAKLFFEKYCGKIKKYKGKIGVGDIGKFVKFNGKMGGEKGKQNRKVGGKIRIFENMVANQKN